MKDLTKLMPVLGKMIVEVPNIEVLNDLLSAGSSDTFWEYEYDETYSILYKDGDWYFSTYIDGYETQELLTINVNGIPEF